MSGVLGSRSSFVANTQQGNGKSSNSMYMSESGMRHWLLLAPTHLPFGRVHPLPVQPEKAAVEEVHVLISRTLLKENFLAEDDGSHLSSTQETEARELLLLCSQPGIYTEFKSSLGYTVRSISKQENSKLSRQSCRDVWKRWWTGGCLCVKDRIRIKQNRSYLLKKRRERASEIYGARIKAKQMMLSAEKHKIQPWPHSTQQRSDSEVASKGVYSPPPKGETIP